MKTLIIAPHQDDEAISCGGLIQARLAAGWGVSVLSVFSRTYDYGDDPDDSEEQKDFIQSCRTLGVENQFAINLREGEPGIVGYYEILRHVEEALRAFGPDEVVIPSAGDLNQDHRHLNHAMQIALRPANLGDVHRVLEFVALDGQIRHPNYFVPLTDAQVQVKLRAVAAYRRESRVEPSPRAPINMLAMMHVWGAACGERYAEGYQLRMSK
jgi:LmbE family N-acetylglucosaminyl deacetylase